MGSAHPHSCDLRYPVEVLLFKGGSSDQLHRGLHRGDPDRHSRGGCPRSLSRASDRRVQHLRCTALTQRQAGPLGNAREVGQHIAVAVLVLPFGSGPRAGPIPPREKSVCNGLAAGGSRIRTVGPSPEGCGLFSPKRRARSIGIVFDKYRPVGGLAVSNSAPSVGESGPRVARPLAWDNGFPRLQRINARESLLSPDQPNLW
jgi:hypothetical protein